MCIRDRVKARFLTYRDHFIDAMEDDMNTADALSSVFELARDINTTLGVGNHASKELCEFALRLYDELNGVLGLLYNRKEQSLDEEIEELIRQRTEARKDVYKRQARGWRSMELRKRRPGRKRAIRHGFGGGEKGSPCSISLGNGSLWAFHFP